MTRSLRFAPVAMLLAVLLPAAVSAEVSRVEITGRRDLAGGRAFGAVGPYEQLTGKLYFLILKSLADALTRLAGEPFEAAFGRSINQDDYRWGKLHRIVFAHQLGSVFSVPPAGGAFPHPLGETLPGIPMDGGFEVLDRSDHDARGDNSNGFMFDAGATQRLVTKAERRGMSAETSLPGGPSGVLGSPYYLNLLPSWLTNEAFPLLFESGDVQKDAAAVMTFVPAR